MGEFQDNGASLVTLVKNSAGRGGGNILEHCTAACFLSLSYFRQNNMGRSERKIFASEN